LTFDFASRLLPSRFACSVWVSVGLQEHLVTEAAWGAILAMPPANVASSSRPAMLPATRAILNEFYAPYNRRLAEVMDGDERWLWHLQVPALLGPGSQQLRQ
jgi:hypothetical protein